MRPSRAARSDTVEGDGIAWVGPAAVLHSVLPYIDSTAEWSADRVDQPCEALSVLVVPKAGEVRAAVNAMPVAAGRGVLALRPAEPDDAWWLLHEIRARSSDLSTLAQGSSARELSARAFLEAQVRWPPAAVKARLGSIARALYGRALVAHQENRRLRDLLTAALSELEPKVADVH